MKKRIYPAEALSQLPFVVHAGLNIPVPQVSGVAFPVRIKGRNGFVMQNANPNIGETRIPTGTTVTLITEGVFEHPMPGVTASTIANNVSVPVYITSSNTLTLSAGGNTLFGHVWDVAASGLAHIIVANPVL